MSREQTEYIRSRVSVKDYADGNLQKRGKKYYVCPGCGCGTHKNGTACFSIYKNNTRFGCFSCKADGDVFDLAGMVTGAETLPEQVKEVARWAGITLTEETPSLYRQPLKAKQEKPAPDYSKGQQEEREYLARCRQNIEDPEAVAFIESRGFTLEQAKQWGWGYDPNHEHGAQDENGNWLPGKKRLIIAWPGSDCYHIDRFMDSRAKNMKYSKPKSDKVGAQPVWNPQALRHDVFFIVEGQMDACAIASCGYQAIAMSTTTDNTTLTAIKGKAKSGATAYLLMDADKAGQEAAKRIVEELSRAKVDCVDMLPPYIHEGGASLQSWQIPFANGACKDAADLHKMDKSLLTAALQWAEADHKKRVESLEEQEMDAVLEAFNVKDPLTVVAGLMDEDMQQDPIPTGFKALDGKLGGGLMAGVYVIGAVSSLGKTTWCVQVADQIAEAGHPVLFVTIEMRAREIAAKSISRYAWRKNPEYGNKDPHGAVITALDIQNRLVRKSWDMYQRHAFESATADYINATGGHLQIMEGTGKPTVRSIESVVRQMRRKHGVAPVVFIDYLQLLGTEEGHERDTDKQNMDRNIMALRQLAGDLQTPVFIISSFNRDSYNSAVSMSSFKESGGIEYGADVVIGLQPCGAAGMNKSDMADALDDARTSRVREVELTILKNRNGMTTGSKDGIEFWYDAMANCYTEK